MTNPGEFPTTSKKERKKQTKWADYLHHIPSRGHVGAFPSPLLKQGEEDKYEWVVRIHHGSFPFPVL